MKFAQTYCTVADLISDANAPGVDDARMFEAISEASDYLQKRIGWFVPVTLTRRFNGNGRRQLQVPPLLSITSILNDETVLTDADYLLRPNDGFWANGPYGQLVVDDEATNLAAWWCEEDGVVITGAWGKYSRSGETGASVQDAGNQSASQSTLLVDNGGLVSPGMVLLIGSEQEQVTGWDVPTAAVTTLDGAVAASDETITVADGTEVNIGEVIRVDFEQMRIKDKRGDLLSVVRGWNGTGRVAHLTAAEVDVYRTLKVERGVNGTTAAIHVKDVSISRYFAPDDITGLTKQIATLLVNKAKGGYQGRSGNAETGVVFYNDAFPKYDIERLAKEYDIPRIG